MGLGFGLLRWHLVGSAAGVLGTDCASVLGADAVGVFGDDSVGGSRFGVDSCRALLLLKVALARKVQLIPALCLHEERGSRWQSNYVPAHAPGAALQLLVARSWSAA